MHMHTLNMKYMLYNPYTYNIQSREQQKSHVLDIVTGFQVLDGTMHMFVLEGLREKGIKDIWCKMPKPENTG